MDEEGIESLIKLSISMLEGHKDLCMSVCRSGKDQKANAKNVGVMYGCVCACALQQLFYEDTKRPTHKCPHWLSYTNHNKATLLDRYFTSLYNHLRRPRGQHVIFILTHSQTHPPLLPSRASHHTHTHRSTNHHELDH